VPCLKLPWILHLLAKYYDLDRYRSETLFAQKIAVPEMLSWEDPKAQGAIIRWIAMPGGDDIDDPSNDSDSDRVEPEPPGFEGEIGSDDEILKPYEETEGGKEEAIVQGILDEWLRRKCGVEGGVVFCAECYKFMRLRPENGRRPWCTKMLTRGL
jgi:hypothetical protein